MSSSRHARVKEIFLEAAELSSDECSTFLDRACADDPGLRAEVEELLEFDRAEPQFLEGALDSGDGDSEGGASAAGMLRRLEDRIRNQSRYELRGEFARGGMGAVLRVWDRDLRRTLAMKVVLEQGDAPGEGDTPPVDARSIGRFLEEAQVTGQLDHPGVVPVHELGLDEQGRVFFTMKLVKGRDLKTIFDLVRAGEEGWTRLRALGVISRVCEAMAYAHSKQVIHRDLKPANVMVGRFGEVYVMDWGLARVVGREDEKDIRLRPQAPDPPNLVRTDRWEDAHQDSPLLTMDGDVVGTPAYMSPEQAAGDLERMGPASDVYSVGAILYHLLAGHMPYAPPGSRLSGHAIWALVQSGPPAPLDTVARDAPAELVAICEKAMQREIDERYPDMGALAEDVQAFLEHRVVRAYEGGAWAEARKWVRRNRALAASILGGGLVLLGGAAAVALVTQLKNRELAGKNVALAASEEQARTAQGIAEARLEEINRLADLTLLRELDQREPSLWPRRPRRVADMEAWLEQAAELTDRLAVHEEDLTRLREKARPLGEVMEGSGDDALHQAPWRFERYQDQWRHDNLAALVEGVTAFADDANGEGLISAVEARLEVAGRIEAETVGAFAEEWDEAIFAILVNDRYGGLELVEQVGLVPIGEDPDTWLWEFWHVESGERPVRDVDTGKLVLTEEIGIVLVLIPGGTCWVGSQKDDPDEPNYDPGAEADEVLRQVTVEPFFLSKYELTQAQWERLAGSNPSRFQTGKPGLPQEVSLLHPVESVSWESGRDILFRYDLALPAEEQWEYAARAETPWPWWTGAEGGSLEGMTNIADASFKYAAYDAGASEPWNDRYAIHAPVGHFAANSFGLYDVLGNVLEWCADELAEERRAPAPEPDSAGTPREASRAASDRLQVLRGGSYTSVAGTCRVALRMQLPPGFTDGRIGIRPARTISE